MDPNKRNASRSVLMSAAPPFIESSSLANKRCRRPDNCFSTIHLRLAQPSILAAHNPHMDLHRDADGAEKVRAKKYRVCLVSRDKGRLHSATRQVNPQATVTVSEDFAANETDCRKRELTRNPTGLSGRYPAGPLRDLDVSHPQTSSDILQQTGLNN